MNPRKLQTVEIGGTLKFEFETWESFEPTAEFVYMNRATDHWSSDSEVSIEIDKETALMLISVLQSYIDYPERIK